MSRQIIQRLTARYDYLRQQNDAEFCRQFPSYFQSADSDGQARRVLGDLRREADAAARAFSSADERLTEELIAIRDRLVADAPEIAPDRDPAEPQDLLRRREWLIETILGFDQVAHADREEIGFSPLLYYSVQDNPGRTQTLIQILRGRLFVAEWGVQFGRGQPVHKLRDDLEGYQRRMDARDHHQQSQDPLHLARLLPGQPRPRNPNNQPTYDVRAPDTHDRIQCHLERAPLHRHPRSHLHP